MDPSSSWGCGRCWQGGATVALGLSWRPSDKLETAPTQVSGSLPCLFPLVGLTWDIEGPVSGLGCAEVLPGGSFEVQLQLQPAKSSL